MYISNFFELTMVNIKIWSKFLPKHQIHRFLDIHGNTHTQPLFIKMASDNKQELPRRNTNPLIANHFSNSSALQAKAEVISNANISAESLRLLFIPWKQSTMHFPVLYTNRVGRVCWWYLPKTNKNTGSYFNFIFNLVQKKFYNSVSRLKIILNSFVWFDRCIFN